MAKVKVKALKDFQSSILSMQEGETRELDLDEHTFESWTSSGLIEKVKKASPKKVKADED
jgi:oligoribonuclease (3'-5' exoribonuclease)